MEPPPFRSYAQNQEDVALWRALGHIEEGHYVEVGAYHPTIKSTSYAFYERGWRGLLIEPQEEFCRLSKRMRPEDQIVHSAVGSKSVERVPFYRTPGGARSTMQAAIAEGYGNFHVEEVPCSSLNDLLNAVPWSRRDFHFLVIDVEGSESEAIEGLDLSRYRPWILIVEAIDPLTREDVSSDWASRILSNGYLFSHFDGVSQFFVAQEHAEFLPRLYPACSTDDYVVDFPRLPAMAQLENFDAQKSLKEILAGIADLALADLVQLTGIPEYTNEALLDRGSQLVNALASDSIDTIDALEQYANVLKVAASRARLYHHLIREGALKDVELHAGEIRLSKEAEY